jgi:hypothetical protein
MFGVLMIALPFAPTQSERCWSVMMNRMFGCAGGARERRNREPKGGNPERRTHGRSVTIMHTAKSHKVCKWTTAGMERGST